MQLLVHTKKLNLYLNSRDNPLSVNVMVTSMAALNVLFWLNGTGATLSVILGLSASLAIIISAAVCVLYTLFGGFFSVAYTDAVQLAVMLLGLVNVS